MQKEEIAMAYQEIYDRRRRNLARRRKRRVTRLIRGTLAVVIILAGAFAVKKVLGDHLLLTKDGITWIQGLMP